MAELKALTAESSPGANARARRRRAFLAPAAIALAVLPLYAGLTRSGALRLLDLRAYDAFFRLRSHLRPPLPPADIVIVAVDETSMRELGRAWPWPRSVHAGLLQALARSGAAVVGFDIVFADATQDAEDGAFATAIGDAGHVVLAEDYVVASDRAAHNENWVHANERLLEKAAGAGLVQVPVDPDGTLRRASLQRSTPFQEEPVPSLALVIAETFRKKMGAPVDPADPARTFHLPAAADEPLLINYLGPPRSVRTVSYYQALEPEKTLEPGAFKNKVVLVGLELSASAEILRTDQFLHPFLATSNMMPGVEVHATIVDTLLRERYLKPLSPAAAALLFALFLAATVVVLARSPVWLGVGLFALLAASFVALHLFLFTYAGRTGFVVTPVAALTAYVALERLYRYAVQDREKRFIHKAFQHYVPAKVVEQLMRNPERLNLYGEHYETTVVFTDLVGFTSVAERTEPMKLRTFLTGYFTEMVDIMLANQGTLDKFIGDAMMCFFGVPIATPEHAYQGCMTAYQMRERLVVLNQRWSAEGLPELGMRIGVNTGQVVAGNMGTATLFNYTIMGDCVNLGSRLEGANKRYGTHIIIGEATHALTGERFDTRKLDRIRAKGKNQAITIYELVGLAGSATPERRLRIDAYERAFAAYTEQRFGDAIGELEVLAAPLDGAEQLLLERCRDFLVAPPGEDWDGVHTMTTK